jgi:hypothetical protein
VSWCCTPKNSTTNPSFYLSLLLCHEPRVSYVVLLRFTAGINTNNGDSAPQAPQTQADGKGKSGAKGLSEM